MNQARLRFFMGLGPLGSWPLPGMWGSLAGLVLAWFLPQPSLWIVVIACSAIGIALCPSVIKIFHESDPQWFNWDELCGMILSVSWAPKQSAYYFVAFVLFRIFDSWKPWPISVCEKNTGAGGIVWDDLAAGLLSAAVLPGVMEILFRIIPASIS